MKQTITSHLRAHLLKQVMERHPNQAMFAQQRVNELFGMKFEWIIGHAKDRIMMGTFRYETHKADVPYWRKAFYGLVPSYRMKMDEKLRLYDNTRNQEYLIDALNYVLLELTHPCINDTFFESTERHE